MNVTPSVNRKLSLRHGDFGSLCQALDYAAAGETGFNFYSGRGQLASVLTYKDLRARAIDLAPRLRGMNLKRLDRVALIAETSPEFAVLFFACQYAGLVPVPLPLCVNFDGANAYRRRLHGMLESADVGLAIAPPALVDDLRAAACALQNVKIATIDAVCESDAPDMTVEPLAADDPCYIQYSSGSTSFPRGVVVSQQGLAANARSIGRDGLALRPGDRCCSWLPLYHDMGLVGCCLTPMMNQVSVDYLATSAFAKRPHLWLQLITRNRASISFGPTFGYELCNRRAARGIRPDLDLSSWRVAGIGGEMIRPSVLRQFAEIFAEAGFREQAFMPSYGMAETTLAVTFSKLGSGLRADRVPRRGACEEDQVQAASDETDGRSRPVREFAFCGKPMPGYDIEIRDRDGRKCGERQIGRIFIKGPSTMAGYFREPAQSRAILDDEGWLASGDLGYFVDGDLVVTGRSKDLIIIGGRNIWPQDLEWAVEGLDDVRSGDSAAFALSADDGASDGGDGHEIAVIAVECRMRDAAMIEALRQTIRTAAQRVAGIDCKVVLLPPRSLAFTTSGKLSRAAVKSAYSRGELTDVADNMVDDELMDAA